MKGVFMANYMLSTKDNPFNPFTNFDSWLNYDSIHGYNTCNSLDRIAMTSNALSDDMNDEEIIRAMDVLIDAMPDLYIKLEESTADSKLKEIANMS